MSQFLKNKRGESLVETLVAILIFTLASIALYSTVTSSARVNYAARLSDQAVQEQLQKIESAAGTVKAGSISMKLPNGNTQSTHVINVDVYIGSPEDEDSLYAYYKQP